MLLLLVVVLLLLAAVLFLFHRVLIQVLVDALVGATVLVVDVLVVIEALHLLAQHA